MPLVHRHRWLLALVMVLTFPVAVWAALPAGAADPAQDVEEIARWIRERQDGAAKCITPGAGGGVFYQWVVRQDQAGLPPCWCPTGNRRAGPGRVATAGAADRASAVAIGEVP